MKESRICRGLRNAEGFLLQQAELQEHARTFTSDRHSGPGVGKSENSG